MTVPDVKVWSVTPGLLSEGPRWHEERQELLWSTSWDASCTGGR
jgi:sugar lactone lactonase YvrE